MTSYGYIILIIVDSCMILFHFDCIMRLKKSYHIATNVCSRKSATTFGDLPYWLWYGFVWYNWPAMLISEIMLENVYRKIHSGVCGCAHRQCRARALQSFIAFHALMQILITDNRLNHFQYYICIKNHSVTCFLSIQLVYHFRIIKRVSGNVKRENKYWFRDLGRCVRTCSFQCAFLS